MTKTNATHYTFVYHCLYDAGYQVGMSTATSPLGPWSKPLPEPTVLITESPASSASSSPVKAEAAKPEDAGEADVTYPSTDLMMHEHAGPWTDVALDGPSAF